MTEKEHLIYIADDEPELLAVLQEALETAGHRVEAFPTGDALLERSATQAPDLVLLDINMPGRSGWEIRSLLQEQPTTQDVPVIAVTAQGGQSVEASATETLAFADFLRKPFRMADLWQKVDAALQTPP